MIPQLYSAKWDNLQTGRPDPEAIGHLARQMALSFMDACLYCDRYEHACIRLLCEMATAFEADSGLNAEASSALFNIVVEGLCDEFEDMQVEIYDRVMCQIISFCRNIPRGRDLDEKLSRFGFVSRESLLGRAAGMRRHFFIREDFRKPEKIIFLSRVTFGADIAVTSVLIQRFANAFPEAELVLLGSGKLKGLFGGLENLRLRELHYPRRGDLMARFSVWFSTLEAIEEETAAIGDRFLVIDPDSRLSQLGILPVTDTGRYFFFNSRYNGSSPYRLSMSELANEWTNRILPESGFCHPGVWVDEASKKTAQVLITQLRRFSAHIVTVNLGVGGNRRKRLDDDFECRLLASLLSEEGTSVILDCGADEEEKKRARELLSALRRRGYATAEADMNLSAQALSGPGIISILSSIGEIAAVISASDEFIGYDSACQHIAAAAGIPSCTVFAGSNNPRFVRRWHARGQSVSRIIHVDNLSRDKIFDNADIIARINAARDRA